MELKSATLNSIGARRRQRGSNVASTRRTALTLAVLAVLVTRASPAAADPAGPAVRLESGLLPPTHAPKRVVVLRRSGCQVYETIVEEFRGRVRAIVKVLPAVPRHRMELVSWLRSYDPQLIFAVGQSAYDEVRQTSAGPLLHTLTFHDIAPQHLATPSRVSPLQVMQAFRALHPSIHSLAVLHGEGTAAEAAQATVVAAPLGITLQRQRARTPAEAITLLRRLDGKVQGLWLLTDLRILTPQVVQYALGIQFRRRVPLMGATRRHVEQGALLALDFDPHDLGRLAAAMANQVLAGPAGRGGSRRGPPLPAIQPRLTVNRSTAQAIGARIEPLTRLQAEVLQ